MPRSSSLRARPLGAFLVATLVGCPVASILSCSAVSDDDPATGKPGGAGGATASGGAGGVDAAGEGAGGGGGKLFEDAGPTDAKLTPDAACSATSAEAKLLELDMVILLDRSGSMKGVKWDGSTEALKSFLNDPASAGVSVGITFYPIDDPPPGTTSCTYNHYLNPVVPVGLLPANAPALVSAIDAEEPLGSNTPTYGALKGVLHHATALQDQLPSHKVIVVLASDGDPNTCPGNQNQIDVIAQLAASAYNYNSVQTYVIAVQGSTVPNLDKIAAAGGTGKAFDVTLNIDQFAEKMEEIRTAALACEFIIPPPPDNLTLDPDKVNVTFTPGGGAPVELLRADNLADCAGGPGWYYDNNATPAKIFLCPETCKLAQNDKKAKIDVIFGCDSKTK